MKRVKRLSVDPELLKFFFQEGLTWRVLKSELPPDAEYRGIAHDPSRNVWSVFFSHPSFPEVPENAECPEIEPPRCERVYIRNSIYEVVK